MGRLGGRVKGYLSFATGLIECFGFAGVVTGWPSLVFVLKREQYFAELCEVSHNSSRPGASNATDCVQQDDRFTFIFTIASSVMNVASVGSGLLLDYCGTMATRFLAISIYTAATLMIAFSTAASATLLFPALSMLGIGGISFLITNIQIGNIFGNKRSTVITIYDGAYDSSPAVFLVVKVLYEAGISLRSIFLFISCLSLLHIMRTIFLLPITRIPFPLPDGYTYGVTCAMFKLITFSREAEGAQWGAEGTYNQRIEETGAGASDRCTEEQRQAGIAREGSVSKENEEEITSFRNCVFSRLFLTHMLWLSIMQLRLFMFIGTLNPMLNLLTNGDPRQVSRFTDTFAISQLFAIFFSPFSGLILDRHKRKGGQLDSATGSAAHRRLEDMQSAVLSLAITVMLSVLFSLCAAIPVLWLQYPTFVLLVIHGTFLYGNEAAFLAIAFPMCHFGKIYSVALGLGGIACLLQYPCMILIKVSLKGNPFYMNIAFLVLVTLAFVHPLNVYYWCRREKINRLA